MLGKPFAISVMVIAIFTAAAVFIHLFLEKTPRPQIELTPEAKESVEKTRPALSEDEDAYLTLLAESVIPGGPPKDGIPSIDNPKYTSAAEGDEWLFPNDVVFGVDYKGFVAAYPQRILVWHEIVNEVIAGEMVSITYCPLTGSAIGFKGEYAPGVSAQFGVSGKLVNSCLVMFDRKSDSYWPQILGKAISGPARGIKLKEFPVVWTTWEKWRAVYPGTKVLSRDTGFFRNYGRGGDPYGSYLENNKGYYESERLFFRPLYRDDRLHPKKIVVGVRDERRNALAIVKDRLREKKAIEAQLGGMNIVITYNETLDSHEAKIKETGQYLNSFDAFWFAWYAFYPNTQLLQ
jgi:hypothetical protein